MPSPLPCATVRPHQLQTQAAVCHVFDTLPPGMLRSMGPDTCRHPSFSLPPILSSWTWLMLPLMLPTAMNTPDCSHGQSRDLSQIKVYYVLCLHT